LLSLNFTSGTLVVVGRRPRVMI